MVATDDAAWPVLKPVERFEWERIVRRVQMPSGTKYLALMMATYADQDGTRVRPGVECLGRVMCVSEKTVKRGLSELREIGLIQRTKQGNRHAGLADEYRLVCPSNLLDRPMLGPEESEVSTGHG